MEKMKLNIQLFATTIGPSTNNPYYSGKTGTGSHSGGSNRFYWEVKVTCNSQTSGSAAPVTKFTIQFIETGNWGSYSGQNSTYVEIDYRIKPTGGSWSSWSRIGSQDKAPSFNKGSTTVQCERTYNLSHNNDGTSPSIQFRGIITSTNTQDWSPVDCTVTTTELIAVTIPRASAITSVTSGTTDYYPEVVWTPASNTFTYKVGYSYGGWSYVSNLISPASTSAQTFNSYQLTSGNLASYMPDASETFTATLYTYQSDGTTLIGSTTKTFTVTLNEAYKPTVTVSNVTDAGGIVPSGWGVYVQGKSKLSFTITATASTGSTISSYRTSIESTVYTTSSVTTGFLQVAGSNGFQATATDSRNRTGSSLIHLYNVEPYSSPTITVASAERCLQDGTLSDAGTYLKYSFAANVSSCGSNNVGTYKLRYKLKTDTTYTDVTISNNQTDVVLPNVQFNASLPYDIQFTVSDSFNETDFENLELRTGFKLVHYNRNKRAIALGKSSEAITGQKLLEVALPLEFVDEGKSSILDLIYPVGSIYMSTNNVSPQTFFGGVWQPIEDTFLLSAGQTYTAGDTGGEAEHLLISDEIPAHTHGRKSLTGQWRSKKARFPGSSERSGIITEWEANQSTYWNSSGGTDTNTVGWKIDASHEHTSFGGGLAHNNMPPYLVVYMWERTQ